MRRRRSSYGVSKFRAKKLGFSMFQGLSSAAASSSQDRVQSLAKMSLELHSSPPAPFSTELIESSTPQPQAHAKGNDGTPKHHKQFGCKQTKCLKL